VKSQQTLRQKNQIRTGLWKAVSAPKKQFLSLGGKNLSGKTTEAQQIFICMRLFFLYQCCQAHSSEELYRVKKCAEKEHFKWS